MISACFYCNEFYYKKHLTKDHVIPKSRGGTNHKSNLFACCKGCNVLKSNLNLTAFICLCQKQIELNKADGYIVKKYTTIINNINYLLTNYITKHLNEMRK